MSELPDFSTWTVKNSEQATKLVQAQMKGLEGRRNKVFVMVPDATGAAAREQKKQYSLLMMDYGFVCGLIDMAHAVGFLEDEAYYHLKQDAHRLTMPGIVGATSVQMFGG